MTTGSQNARVVLFLFAASMLDEVLVALNVLAEGDQEFSAEIEDDKVKGKCSERPAGEDLALARWPMASRN